MITFHLRSRSVVGYRNFRILESEPTKKEVNGKEEWEIAKVYY